MRYAGRQSGKRYNSRVLFIIVAVSGMQTMNKTVAAECQGTERRVENPSGYSFITTSRVYHGAGSEIYETCVENKNDRWLWINWSVPGPSGWIPPQGILPSPRTFTSRDTQPYDGCLEYGNLAETMREHFLGNSLDRKFIEAEQQTGCKENFKINNLSTDGENIAPVKVDIHTFFPSNKENPSETMLELQGKAEIYGIDDNTYDSLLAYDVTRIGEHGDPLKVTVKPLEKEQAGEYLSAFFNKAYSGKNLRLDYKNFVKLVIVKPKYAVLLSGKYGFFDENGQFVGAVFVPIWAPAQR